MKVRCGACRTEFDVAGEGRHACPTCGAVNQVTGAVPGVAAAPPPSVSPQPPTPPAPAAAPLPKVTCGECSFEFVVGDIDVATCPNCSAEVEL
jgi:Zn finger protein HypA/HybF involved in hydrogenase expression